MTEARRFPVWDNHFHLDPRGARAEAVKQFARAGGTHMLLVHKPYGDSPRFNRTLDDHREAFETTLRLADEARAAVPEVKIWVALAPHPAEFTKMLEAGHPMEEAKAVYAAASELAARYVEAGKAVAMGEVGRPHWQPVPDDVWAAANELFEGQLAAAKDAGCPVVIHCETGTPEVYADLALRCDAVGFPREKAVKHFSPPVVDEALNRGLFPSVLIGKDAAEDALKQGTRFMMETDYMDDPRYPGAVLGPKTVPKRTLALVASGAMTEEQAWTVHREMPKRVYGVEVELR